MAVAEEDVLKIVWQFKVDGVGTRGQNVFWYQVTTLVSGDEGDVQDDFETKMVAMFANASDWFSSDYSLEHLRMTNETQKQFVGQEFPVFAGGGAAGASTPAQVAVEVLGRATKLGHVARKYLGPCIEATHDDGRLVAGALADFGLFAVEYTASFVGATSGNLYQPVMVKVLPGGAVGEITNISDDLFTVIPTARTMRSRIPGRGLS